MSLPKLWTLIFFSLPIVSYSQSNLDRYYTLEDEVEKLNIQFKDNQNLISQKNTFSKHFWSPSTTKKSLDRLNRDQQRILNEIAPKIKEMKRLEQTLQVEAWYYSLETFTKVNVLLGAVSQNNVCSSKGRQLFYSNEAFEVWNSLNGDLDRKVSYYAKKNSYIANCLKIKKEGDHASVDGRISSLCKKVDWLPDKNTGNKKSYQVKKKDGKIYITAKLYFTYKGDSKNKKESFKRLREAKSCMQNFYARHGIKLDITLYEQSGLNDWWSCDHSLYLHDSFSRANSSNWTTHQTVKRNLDAKDRCSIFLHELGHLLGLPDTYPDPDCPDRETIGPEDDIMHNSWKGAKKTRLYPSAIKSILKPLCGD